MSSSDRKIIDCEFGEEDSEVEAMTSRRFSQSGNHLFSNPTSPSLSGRSRSNSNSTSQSNSKSTSPIKQIMRSNSNSKLLTFTGSNNKAFEALKSPKKISFSENNNSESKRDSKSWIIKHPPLVACCSETLGQEKFRLFTLGEMSHKTRLCYENNKFGVMSEKITSYASLEEEDLNKLTPDELIRLGMIFQLSHLLVETDLKTIHVSKQGKIDGDFLYSPITDPVRFKKCMEMKEEDIASLPYLQFADANQWLDQIQNGARKKIDKKLKFYSLTSNPHFRQGVNQALLLPLLTPDDLFKKMDSWYIQDDEFKNLPIFKDLTRYTDQIYQMDIERVKQSLNAALKHGSFKDYVQSPKAGEYVVKFKQYLREHILTGSENLVSEADYPKVKAAIDEKFNTVKRLAKPTAQASATSSPKLFDKSSKVEASPKDSGKKAFKKQGK